MSWRQSSCDRACWALGLSALLVGVSAGGGCLTETPSFRGHRDGGAQDGSPDGSPDGPSDSAAPRDEQGAEHPPADARGAEDALPRDGALSGDAPPSPDGSSDACVPPPDAGGPDLGSCVDGESAARVGCQGACAPPADRDCDGLAGGGGFNADPWPNLPQPLRFGDIVQPDRDGFWIGQPADCPVGPSLLWESGEEEPPQPVDCASLTLEGPCRARLEGPALVEVRFTIGQVHKRGNRFDARLEIETTAGGSGRCRLAIDDGNFGGVYLQVRAGGAAQAAAFQPIPRAGQELRLQTWMTFSRRAGADERHCRILSGDGRAVIAGATVLVGQTPAAAAALKITTVDIDVTLRSVRVYGLEEASQ